MAKVIIEFHPAAKRTEVERGSALRDAAETAGVELRMPCGGKGRCGKCKVVFERGAPPPTPTELDGITESELAQGYRLACQAQVLQDCAVYVPDAVEAAKILTVGTARRVPLKPAITKRHVDVPRPSVDDLRSDLARILDSLGVAPVRCRIDLHALRQLGHDAREADFEITGVFSSEDLIAFEPGDTTAECYGVAFDIGTTTLAAYLLDLNTGDQLSVAAAVNPQARIGDDVISRISYTMQAPDGLEKLRSMVVGELNRLVGVLAVGAGISRDRIYEAAVVGNTCMLHLFLGIDPKHLAQAPYVPTVSQSLYFPADELGIDINEFGRVHFLPSIAGYVGADTVGMVLATALYEGNELTLAVDIGTNGEIVLGAKNGILACSTAAGPAFEGAHIKHGMRAALGAIDAVWFDDGDIAFSTVSGAKAAGICGSGLLDAIACLVQAGIIEPGGRIVDASEAPVEYGHFQTRLRTGDRGNEFMLAPADETSIGGPIVITQRDVREVQLAKGAIAAGIQTLMERLGVRPGDIDRVVLAGAFGNYVRKESAIMAGMLPDVPLAKVHSVGNAAGEGAKLSLISLDMRKDADHIADFVEYIELTTDLGFHERFADALAFGAGSVLSVQN